MSQWILIVEDEPNVRLSYRITLETEGWAVREADCGARALAEFACEHFDLAILDMRMPEMDGLDLLAEMRRRGIKAPEAIKYGPYYEPAQQNMRRIFELFHFGSSKEPLALGDD